jgi:hypothetical protein
MPRKRGRKKCTTPEIAKGTTTQLWRAVYKSDQYRKFKAAVRKKGAYKCSSCGSKGSVKNRLHVHHTKPKAKQKFLKYLFDTEKAKVLCHLCHIEEHKEMKKLHPEYDTMLGVSEEELVILLKDLTFDYYQKKRFRPKKYKRRKKC